MTGMTLWKHKLDYCGIWTEWHYQNINYIIVVYDQYDIIKAWIRILGVYDQYDIIKTWIRILGVYDQYDIIQT